MYINKIVMKPVIKTQSKNCIKKDKDCALVQYKPKINPRCWMKQDN